MKIIILQKKRRLILALVLIILGTGIISYLVYIGMYSDTRDDNASLGQVQEKSEENTVVMYFWSNGCQPCNEQKPIIKNLENDYKGSNVTFYWFDATNHDDITNHYNVNGVPTTIILNQNGVYKKYVGKTDYSSIARSIDGSINTY